MDKIKKYTLKMESLGNFLIFRNRPSKKQRKVLDSEKEPKKEPVKVLTLKQERRKKAVNVLDYKTGTKNRIDCLKLVSPSYRESRFFVQF